MPGQAPYNLLMPSHVPQQHQQQQPGAEQWMAIPQGIQGCPPGLEYLTQIDQLLVKQEVEIFEVMTGIETANKYKIQNSMGQDVYKAEEKSDFCSRMCCGPIRDFHMEITDHTGREVLHLDRPLNCGTVSRIRFTIQFIISDFSTQNHIYLQRTIFVHIISNSFHLLLPMLPPKTNRDQSNHRRSPRTNQTKMASISSSFRNM